MLCGLLLLLLLMLQLLLLLLLLANGPFELVGTPLELRDGVRPSEKKGSLNFLQLLSTNIDKAKEIRKHCPARKMTLQSQKGSVKNSNAPKV